jgi:hypothetical protein
MSGSLSSSDFQSEEDYAWVSWFCSLKGNEFFCEIEGAHTHKKCIYMYVYV